MTRGVWSVAWIVLLLAALLPGPVRAQASLKALRVGFLSLNEARVEEPVIALLRTRGLVEGQNLVAERRRAEGHPERLPALAAELANLEVDMIVAFTNAAALAARAATSRIPIVVWAAHDAVGIGLVSSLARPGGNVTGIDSLAPLLDAKRIELLREMQPGTKQLGVVYNPADPGTVTHLKVATDAARAAGISLLPFAISDRQGIERLVASLERERLDALLTFTDPITNLAFERIAATARARRLPTICEFRMLVQRGCLISYGATLDEFNERVAATIERIHRGAKPAELPVEQPTRFELVVNRKLARELGMIVPASIMVRADHVVE